MVGFAGDCGGLIGILAFTRQAALGANDTPPHFPLLGLSVLIPTAVGGWTGP